MSPLSTRVYAAVFFAFDVERSSTSASGFRPATEHLGSSEPNPMYAVARIEGYAAMLRLRFADRIVIPGKDERRYKGQVVTFDGETTPLWQGRIIREMLIKDYGCDGTRIEWVSSTGTTANAAVAISEFLHQRNFRVAEGVVEFVTSHYHIPRTVQSLRRVGLLPLLTSAEAFTLAEAELNGNRLEAEERLRSFGGHFTDPRTILELRGIAMILLGRDQPQTKGW